MRPFGTPLGNAPAPLVVASLPTCRLGLHVDAAGQIGEIIFMPPDAPLTEPSAPAAERFAREIERYLADPQHVFSLPVTPCGTDFQQRVWQRIRSIPPGQTRQYGELAAELSSAPRAVGQACGANPFPLLTPCHRVLGKTGLGGFAHAQNGWLLDTKRWLLQHEGAL